MTFSDIDDSDFSFKEKKFNEEYHLQVAIVDHFRGQRRKGNEIFKGQTPFEGLFVTHIYQGRNKKDGFFLKQLGVASGVTDLLGIYEHPRKDFLIELSKKYNVDIPLYQCEFMEIKTKTGFLSEAQNRFKWFCERLHINWSVVRSVTEAHEVYKKRGLTPRHEAIVEPDLRTHRQKLDDMFDFYAPIKEEE